MALFAKFWNRIAPLPPKAAIRLDATRSAQIDDHIAGKVAPDEPGLALAIVKSGAIVHAAGYGLADLPSNAPIAADTIFHLASGGKQLTGLGILMLTEAGKLNLNDPLSRHIPELAGFDPKVTIRRLLHHTSGILNFYDEEAAEEVVARSEQPTNADIIRTYVDLSFPMARPGIKPGDEFSYNNSGYDLLGTVIERASSQSYHDFFQDRVFDRLGMKDTFAAPNRRANDRRCASGYQLDDDGNFIDAAESSYDNLVGSRSFYTTVLDLCVYDHALATNVLVSAAGMRDALTSGRTNDAKPTDYGFGWFLGVYEGMRFADHQGDWIGYYSYICRYLDRPLSIFILSNNPKVDIVDLGNVATAVYR